MNEQVLQKLKVLAESAKYDVSCASSGTVRRNVRNSWEILARNTDLAWLAEIAWSRA